MYTKFAAYESGGEIHCMVAGDDVVAFAHEVDVAPFVNSMRTLVATHDKKLPVHGLGQVIKEYSVRQWWDIDFCSKFSVHAGDRNTFEGWYILRDPVKLVETK